MTRILREFGPLHSKKAKVGIIAILSVIIITFSMIQVFAVGEITPSNWSPAKDSTVVNTNQKISLYVVDAVYELDSNTLEASLDGTPVSAKLDFKGHWETKTIFVDSCSWYTETVWVVDSRKEGTISFEATGLEGGSHTVDISIADKGGIVLNETWNFNRAVSAPEVLSLTPADGGAAASSSPELKALVRDDYYDLDSESAVLKLDGVIVPSEFIYTGYDNYDTCTGLYLGYVVTDRKEGTFKYQAGNLADGVHTAELSIANVNGGLLTRQWSFTVGVKPTFSEFYPGNGAEVRTVTDVSVKVNDDNLDPATITLKDNDTVIPHSYSPETGQITYNGSFSYGKHTLQVSAADVNGNLGAGEWSFIVDNQAPAYEYLYLSGTDATITDGILKLNAKLTDLVDIDLGVDVKLDGQSVPASVSYEMIYDTCTGTIVGVKSKKIVTIKYETAIADGSHTLTLSRGDKLGNTATSTWNLNVESKPRLTKWQPVTYISDLQPVISANIKDGNDTISSSAITMTLDGQFVTPTYDSFTGNVSYTPDVPLKDESYHTVTLAAYDPGGLANSISWKFNISTYPDMPDSNMTNCSACHEINQDASIPFQAIHEGVSFYGRHNSNYCADCHDYITYPADCLQCHGFEDGTEDAPHGSTPGIKYSLKNYDLYTPIRVIDNREMWDCVICHQPGSKVMGWEGALVKPTKELVKHDIPELHKAAESSCNECHAQSLTREHARPGRTDNADNPINCNTCHKSQDPIVVAAITNNDKNCSACHQAADHEALHTSQLDSNCQSCHSKGLTTEHISNTTTAGKNYDCDTCHNSQRKEVQRTIAADRLNCTGCHNTGHNMNFADIVPEDIPLYIDFSWTTPLEASIFAGEESTPVGYDAGQVIISNSREDVTVTQAWEFYNTNLGLEGWTLITGTPATGATSFSAEFEKQDRFVTVDCDTISKINGGMSPVSAIKLTLWYK